MASKSGGNTPKRYALHYFAGVKKVFKQTLHCTIKSYFELEHVNTRKRKRVHGAFNSILTSNIIIFVEVISSRCRIRIVDTDGSEPEPSRCFTTDVRFPEPVDRRSAPHLLSTHTGFASLLSLIYSSFLIKSI